MMHHAIGTAAKTIAWGMFFVVCPGCATVEIDIAEIRSDVDAGNAAWIDAFRQSDAAALAEVFNEDGALLGANGKVTRGRERIESAMAEIMAGMGPTETTIESDNLWLVEDTAYESGSYSYTFTPKDKTTQTSAGRYVVLWRRDRDGRWKIQFDIGLPDP